MMNNSFYQQLTKVAKEMEDTVNQYRKETIFWMEEAHQKDKENKELKEQIVNNEGEKMLGVPAFTSNLPVPPLKDPHNGELEWDTINGYVNLNGETITLHYDERNEDEPFPGEADYNTVLIRDHKQAYELGLYLIAASLWREKNDA